MRGVAYTGVFEILDSLQILSNIERVGGTSAGAIQACLLAVGYTPAEIRTLAANLPLKQFNDGAWFPGSGIKRLRKEFGWYKGENIGRWIEQCIAAKTGNGDISFEELHQQRATKGYKDLYITGTDLTYQCLRVFSHENYPNMRIRDAVRISLSIPLYYKAVLIDDQGTVYDEPQPDKILHVMVDGGALSNYPLFLFDSLKYINPTAEEANAFIENPQTLGLLMEMPEQIEYNKRRSGNYPIPINTMRDYIKALYVTLIDKASPEANKTDSLRRTLSISNLNLSGRVRKLPPATIDALIESGREGGRRFFGTAQIEDPHF